MIMMMNQQKNQRNLKGGEVCLYRLQILIQFDLHLIGRKRKHIEQESSARNEGQPPSKKRKSGEGLKFDCNLF